MHIFNTNLNEHWGFFVDIEPKPNSKQLPNTKYHYHFKPSFRNRIHSHKSVSNLNELTNNHDIDKEAFFKMDEDNEEEENTNIYTYNQPLQKYEKLNFISNICIVSTIALFVFLI